MNSNQTEKTIRNAQGFFFIAYAAFMPMSVTGAQTCLAILILLAAARRILGKRRAVLPMDIILAAFLIWSVITAFTSVHPSLSLSRLPRVWIHLAWFALVAVEMNSDLIKKAFWSATITGAAMGLYGVAQAWFGPAVPRFFAPPVKLWQPTGGYYHAVGLFDHHLTYGNAMILVLAIGLSLVFTNKGRARVAAAMGSGVILIGVIFSYARSAWIGLLALLAYFAFRKGKKAFIATAIAGTLIVGLALSASTSLRERFFSSFRSDSNLERLYIWKTSLAVVSDHPFVGAGPGTYRSVIGAYREGYNIRWTTAAHAHNSFIQAAVDSGWPAFGLFAAILAASLYGPLRGLKNLPASSASYSILAAVASGILGFAFASLFQHNFGDAEVVMIFWFLAAVGASVSGRARTDSHPQPEG